MQVGSLTMNAELSSMAQQWAEHLLLINTLKHSNDKYRGQPVGENVAAKSGSRTVDFTGIIFIITYSLLNEEKSVSAGVYFKNVNYTFSGQKWCEYFGCLILSYNLLLWPLVCVTAENSNRSFVFTVTRR